MKPFSFNKAEFAFLLGIFLISLSNEAYPAFVFQFADTLNVPADSSLVADSLSATDSLAIADTLAADTVKKSSGFDIDAVIYAESSDSLIFRIQSKKMEIYGNSSLKYKESSIKSSNIFINFETNMMEAYPTVDKNDSTKLQGTPVLTEGSETYEGSGIKYNYKTQQGYISAARTETEGSTYMGAKVKKLDKRTYFVSHGMFSTCDIVEPHYHFYADEMKVILKSQIIGRWIWLYIGGVPLPIPLPFGVFPTQSGRRSGLIAPAYGQSANRGNYFSHLGYFWAINDYMDVNLTGDYFFRGGYGLDSRFRYVKRYQYSGNIDASYSNVKVGESADETYENSQDYRLSLRHNQRFTPSSQLNADLTFQTGSYNRNNSSTLNDLYSQQITSNAAFTKNWEESGVSLGVNYRRTQNLVTGDINETLPDVTVSKGQTYPFRGLSGDSRNPAWYETFGFTYNGKFLNRRNKVKGDLDIRGGIQHNIGMSATQKAGYINISPNASYTEKWYNKRIVRENVINEFGRDTVIDRDKHEINMVRSFSMGVSANTKLYGMFPVNSFGVEAFRHTLMPNVSYSYTPDFSEEKWGYYDTYIDSLGNKVKYDKYGQEIFGGGGAGESQSINFSLGNVFELKTLKDPTDTTSQAKKITLLNLSASMSYNFARDSLKLSDLSVSYNTNIANIFSFNGSSTYSFYVQKRDAKRGVYYIDQFMASQGRGLFRLTNLNFSFGTTLSGEKLKGKEKEAAGGEEANDGLYDLQGTEYQSIYDEEQPDFSIPWDLTLNYSYNMNRSDPQNISQTSGMTLSFNMNLTPSWKFSASGGYDFKNKDITMPQIRIYRDLHCWEMNFSWYPIGYARGYRFEIRVKAPQLQDLKVTRDRGVFQGR